MSNMNITSHNSNITSPGIQHYRKYYCVSNGRFNTNKMINKVSFCGHFSNSTAGLSNYYQSGWKLHDIRPSFSTQSSLDDHAIPPDDSEDEASDGEDQSESTKANSDDVDFNKEIHSGRSIRENLERIVGKDDSGFSGIDLATLIRNKYGRSYDVQLIKKEFMGRNLLALNVMWKYREQRSFPLTEEEYILRLDDVANTLKCWGAVSHIRSSLQNSKERPRIGKAVSIFIDMDESGGRANEWIYK